MLETRNGPSVHDPHCLGSRTGSRMTGSLRETLRDRELMDQSAGIPSLLQAGPTGPSLGVWWSWKQNKRLGTEAEDPHTRSRRDLRGPSPSSALGDCLGQKSSKARVWSPKISLYLTCLGQKAATRCEPAISRDEDS